MKNKPRKKINATIEPMGDWMVLRPIRKEMTQSGRLHIPTGRAELPKTRVLAVGPEVTGPKAGDIVLPGQLPEFPIYEVRVNGETLGVVRSGAIQGVIHGLDESRFEEGMSALETEEINKRDGPSDIVVPN